MIAQDQHGKARIDLPIADNEEIVEWMVTATVSYIGETATAGFTVE